MLDHKQVLNHSFFIAACVWFYSVWVSVVGLPQNPLVKFKFETFFSLKRDILEREIVCNLMLPSVLWKSKGAAGTASHSSVTIASFILKGHHQGKNLKLETNSSVDDNCLDY